MYVYFTTQVEITHAQNVLWCLLLSVACRSWSLLSWGEEEETLCLSNGSPPLIH